MATGFLPSPLRSVRRCLFERSDTSTKHNNNGVVKKDSKEIQIESARRFKRRWNFDVINGEPTEGNIQWCQPSSDADIPEFYKKGYSHKCKRRALAPCVGKSLSFQDSDWDNHNHNENVSLRAPSPVQYFMPTSVDFFVGTVPSPATGVVTPVKVDGQRTSVDDGLFIEVNSDDNLESKPPALYSGGRARQRRMTDFCQVRKRSRSWTPGRRHTAKQDRLGKL